MALTVRVFLSAVITGMLSLSNRGCDANSETSVTILSCFLKVIGFTNNDRVFLLRNSFVLLSCFCGCVRQSESVLLNAGCLFGVFCGFMGDF